MLPGLQAPVAAALGDVCHVVSPRESWPAWLYTSPPAAGRYSVYLKDKVLVWVCRRTQNLSQKLLLSQLPLLSLGAQPNFFALWRGCLLQVELGARPADVHTFLVPDRCYLSNLLKVFAFAKSQVVPQHKHTGQAMVCWHMGPGSTWLPKLLLSCVFIMPALLCVGGSAQAAPWRSSRKAAQLLQGSGEWGRTSFSQRLWGTSRSDGRSGPGWDFLQGCVCNWHEMSNRCLTNVTGSACAPE